MEALASKRVSYCTMLAEEENGQEVSNIWTSILLTDRKGEIFYSAVTVKWNSSSSNSKQILSEDSASAWERTILQTIPAICLH